LLHTFAAEHDVELADTVFIGDALRDIQAALAAGAQPILVKTGKGELTLAANPDLNIPIFNTLYDAARSLVSRQ
jgi:D-glycero-D-manno-heptose 1,7-bisphosphate phosphatase